MELYKLSDFKNKNFSEAVYKLYNLTAFNTKQYPGYLEWFYSKAIPRILLSNEESSAECFFQLDGFQLKGYAMLKKDSSEQKICTLYVDEEYRKNGLGTLLVEKSLDFLKTDRPIITIPEKNIEQFTYYINNYDWKETYQNNNLYSSNEIFFNQRSKY